MKSRQHILYYLSYVIFVTSDIAYSNELPSWINVCHSKQSNVSECIQNNIESLKPKLLDGIPELDIPSFNPLRVEKATLQNPGNFKGTFTDIEIYHAEDFIIENLKVDLDKTHIELKVKFPKLRIKSTYHFDGQILVLKIHGIGPADGNFTNVEGTFVIDGKRIERDGKEYVEFTKTHLDIDVGKPVFQFDNLFGNNTELNDRTNENVNENIESVIEELRPVLNDVVTDIVVSLISSVFKKFSFDTLFPK